MDPELDAWLLAGEIDFAVHSAKDVETLRPPQIAIAAVLPREDVRDVLVGAASVAALPPGRAWSAPARRAAPRSCFMPGPTAGSCLFRGNVATRLAKLAAGEADATLLALAGLNRLGETRRRPSARRRRLAAGAGAGRDRDRVPRRRRRDPRRCSPRSTTRRAAMRSMAERALLAALGGSCHSPVACLTRAEGDSLHLVAALYSPDGAERIEGEISFDPADRAAPARLAADLLARAPPAIAAHFSLPC